MDNILTIQELHDSLQAAVKNDQLLLGKDNFDFKGVTDFLLSLPAHQLALHQPVLQLDNGAKSLTITAVLNESWRITGLNDKAVQVTGIVITAMEMTNAGHISLLLQFSGSMPLGALSLPMSGSLEKDAQVRFQPAGPVSGMHLFSDIAQLINPNGLTSYIPPGIELFEQIPFSAFSISFGFLRTAATTVSFTSDINTDWEIVENLAALKQIGLTVNSHFRYGPGGFVHSFSGNVHAKLKIVQDFQVKLALQATDDWEIKIIPTDGNLLPALGSLFGLIGGSSLQQEFQQGLQSLGLDAFSIDDIRIGFSLQNKKITRVFLAGHITLDEIRFDVSVLLPTLDLHGSLSPATPIHLKALVDKLLPTGSIFPVVDLDMLDISANPKAGSFTLAAQISTDFQIEVAHFTIGLKEIEFEISRSPQGTTGYLEGIITLGGYDFVMNAAHQDAAGGWQFTGQIPRGEEIPIGTFIGKLAQHFNVDSELPEPVRTLKIKDLYVFFDTQTKDFIYRCTCDLSVEGKDVEIRVDIELKQQDGFYTKSFKGKLLVHPLEFDIIFSQDLNATTFLAAYQDPSGGELPIVALLQNVTNDADLLAVAENIHIELKDALFAYYKKDTAKFLFALDLGVGIDLSGLPLVGKLFPPEQSLHLAFQPLIASQKFAQATELSLLTALVPAGGAALPKRDIEAGLSLSASMRFGGTAIDMSLPVSMNSQGQLQHDPAANTGGGNTGAGNGLPPAPAAAAGNIRWFDLQKKLGPVYFEKAGMRYENSELSFLLSASLSLGPLSISLDGLGVTSALHPIDPHFSLNGLGIEYKSPAFEIGGAFLKNPSPPANVEREYDGMALIKTKALTLSALGSYAILKNGHPSLFLYAVLDYPLGGPAFFFVTGLAAGFGYNRGLRLPAVDQLSAFPLISDVVSGKAKAAGSAAELTGKLSALAAYLPPQEGQYFLAVGIKFTSFKLIDSFALLTVSFGRHFEIDLLGLSTLVLPPAEIGSDIEPLAVVQMALKASFIPDEGFLGVEARLTSASYILSKNCHLTGGFAFYCWFDGPHKGDFALTLGGYHPSFSAPAHYPQVPRVGFNWQVDPKLSIKGEAYFALVPSAVMAGGRLSALWDSGSLKAWFIVGADFLISWKPYHYDAEIYLDMGVSYTYDIAGTQHTLRVELGADLHIWGPDFSGQARIHLFIITFDVSFGAGAAQVPEPIGWKEFTSTFLPQAGDVCTIAVQEGLIRKLGEDAGDLGVVNPKELELIVNSVIPSKTAVSPNVAALSLAGLNTDFGIAPMGVDDLSSQQMVEITINGLPVKDKFVFEAVTKEVPAGLWGKKLRPELNGKKVLGNTLAGFRIRAARPTEPDVTQKIDRKNFAFQTDYMAGAYAWQQISTFAGIGLNEHERRAHISNHIAERSTVDARERLLRILEMDDPITVKPDLADAFILAPQVKAATA